MERYTRQSMTTQHDHLDRSVKLAFHIHAHSCPTDRHHHPHNSRARESTRHSSPVFNTRHTAQTLTMPDRQLRLEPNRQIYSKLIDMLRDPVDLPDLGRIY